MVPTRKFDVASSLFFCSATIFQAIFRCKLSGKRRRITSYIYHYKVGDEYKTFELAGNEYVDFEDLKRRASGNEFIQISDDEELPFD